MSYYSSHSCGGTFPRIARSLAVACLGLLVAVPICRGADGAMNHSKNSPWVATWGAAMNGMSPGDGPDFSGKTIREIVHTSVAGSQARVWLSNRFGTEPLRIGTVHIALSASASVGVNEDGTPNQSGVQPGSDRTLTFHHLGSVTIPAGAAIVSDPVTLNVPALSDVAVSIYFPDDTATATTEHASAQQLAYVATGDVTGAASLAKNSWTKESWYVLSGLDVYAPGRSAVVAFGDSITDGAYATVNENHRWPDYLATRLAGDAGTQKAGVLGVVNVGIGGNRVLVDGYGPNAVSRVDWDVLARSGARYLIVLESINDIGRYMRDHQAYGDLAQRLETGIAQLAAQAHQHNIAVIGATITPYQGCGYYSPAGDRVRQAVNEWIRTSHTFDGVADFDKAVRDPQNPLHFAAQYDSGDHLHPRDAGYQAMANSIDLSLFTTKR
jgi:lysophospholipase L1-like esterase